MLELLTLNNKYAWKTVKAKEQRLITEKSSEVCFNVVTDAPDSLSLTIRSVSKWFAGRLDSDSIKDWTKIH